MSAKLLKLLLFLLIFSLPLGQFGRVPGLDPTIGIYLQDLLLGLFCVVAGVYLAKQVGAMGGIRAVSLAPVLGVAFVLWALACLALGASALSGLELLVSFSYWGRLSLFVVLFVEIYILRKVSPGVLTRLPLWLVLSGAILAAAGFVQLVVFPDFGMLDKALGWDPHYFRLNSTFFDPNFTGAYLVLCLGLIGGIGGRRAIGAILGAILLIAIFLTFSRSAWLMLAVVAFIYSLLKARWLLLISLVVAFGAYFAVPRVQTRLVGITDPADSAQFRMVSWQQGLQLSSKSFLTGVGFNALRYAKNTSEFYDYRDSQGVHSGAGFDSSLLVVLATTGIPGLLIFSLFYLVSLAGVVRSTRKGKLLIAASLVALLIESNFINSLFYAPLMVFEASLLGLFVD